MKKHSLAEMWDELTEWEKAVLQELFDRDTHDSADIVTPATLPFVMIETAYHHVANHYQLGWKIRRRMHRNFLEENYGVWRLIYKVRDWLDGLPRSDDI